jgi:DNA polymerase III delta' subunit
MAFKDIAGNERVKRILKKALQKNRVPNSLLFSGPEGIGKLRIAYVMAKALNCEALTDDACESCSSCRSISSKKHPDVMEILPEKEQLQIEQMRFLKQMAYLKPMTGRKRVFIIPEAERMNDDSANSILKILEEPPLFSEIILTTHNAHLILPTIRSRCRILSFAPIQAEEIERILREQDYPEERAKVLSLLVRGNLEKALTLDWEDIQLKRQEAFGLFALLLRREKLSLPVRDYSYSPKSLNKEGLEEFLRILASFFRDHLLLCENGDSRFLLNPDYETKLRQQADALGHPEESLTALRALERIFFGLSKNFNLNLLVASFFSKFGEDHHV